MVTVGFLLVVVVVVNGIILGICNEETGMVIEVVIVDITGAIFVGAMMC